MNRKQRRATARLNQTLTRRSQAGIAAPSVLPSIAELLVIGREVHKAGRFAEAEAHYQRVLLAQPNHAETLNLLGLAAYEMGRREVAINAFERATLSDGNNPGYFSNLGNAFYSCGKFEEAVSAYRDAIGLNPDFPDAYSNLGAALERQGKLDEALCSYRHAIRIKPDFADAYNNLGMVLKRQNKVAQAIAAYRAAIRAKPNDAKAYYNLGVALRENSTLDDVVAAFGRAVDIKPDYAEAFFNLGLALKEQGKLEQSRHALEKAAALSPASPGIYRVLADAKLFHPGDPHLIAMKRLAERIKSFSVTDQIELHFGLAKAYEDLQDFERSFRHLLEGNELKRRQISYDEAAALRRFARVQEVFTVEFMGRLPGVGDQSKVPIFIVGMPRSGTTLVEQILASHPTVFGAGELSLLDDLVAARLPCLREEELDLPEVVASINGEQLQKLGSNYVNGVRSLSSRAERITDKMPLNFFHIGLIHLALPNARIIHVHRDPIDTCVSCFSKLFAGDQPYTYDLAELGRYYRAYQVLMEHWHRVIPPDVILDVEYEEVIADLETQARRVIRHCGLDWDEACLSFHETERPVLTASALQVRQPIHRRSIGRSRSFGQFLAPLKEALSGDS